ncbi:hypothetical protein JCM19239_1453 [Vibrio variabilis]|uniref:ANR family transcriptional regulator n=1 Tax=Vibrio variabilis TaxID=990271 RepID=A0ABQ0JG50_9VIBR|nr:hypothetical protein JCM19239_1453 [Vibrio variabilis]
MFFHQERGTKKRYLELAQEAAELERNYQHDSAAIVWQQAASLASHPANITWAENRHSFCLKCKPVTAPPKRGRPKTKSATASIQDGNKPIN